MPATSEMKPTANDRAGLVEEDDRFDQMAPLSIESARRNTAVNVAWSLRKFPEVSADIGFVPPLSALSDESSQVAPEEVLAIGVLSQAAHDSRRFHLAIDGVERELAAGVLKQAAHELRRFHGATTAVERELYQDAYSWVMSDDSTWPFSFLNVCRLFCSSTAWPHLISVRP